MHGIIVLATVLIITVCSFEEEKKMNPILRHFAQQSRTKTLMQALSSSKMNDGGYRNCYLSPIQCHLPVRRGQHEHITVNPKSLVDDDMIRLRRMLFSL